jgi:CAAX protease family protein
MSRVPALLGASTLAGHTARPRPTSPVGRGWRILAAVEVVAAAAAVIADLLLPSLVLLGMAGVSLAVRRRGLGSLGLRRPAHGWVLTGQMLVFATAWTLLSVGLVIPVAEHLTGERQDMSDFAELEGNLGMLVLLLLASWTLAAFGEELAFRGYVLTRITDVLGSGRAAVIAAVLLSSLLFGLIHTQQGPVGVLLTGLDAIAFAVLRLRFGTVWAPVLAHGFNNTIGFVTFFFIGPVYGLW